jgi:hypothetical protein
MSEETQKKRVTPLVRWMQNLTPEQKEAHMAKVKAGRAKQAQKKRTEIASLRKEAEKMVPRLFAEDLKSEIEGNDWKPSEETRQKLSLLVDQGLTIKELRLKYFSGVSQIVWDKIIRDLFKRQVANEDDLGLRLLQSQQVHLKALQQQLRSVQKDSKQHRKNKEPVPHSLRKMELDLTERIYQLNISVSEAMLKLGVVGEKQKAANINIHMNIERPKAKEVEAIEV